MHKKETFESAVSAVVLTNRVLFLRGVLKRCLFTVTQHLKDGPEPGFRFKMAKIGQNLASHHTNTVCIYIYIYGHNLNQWGKQGSKFQFFPSFIVKNYPEKPPHLVGFFTFQCFVFFPIFVFLALVYHLSLCFLTF